MPQLGNQIRNRTLKAKSDLDFSRVRFFRRALGLGLVLATQLLGPNFAVAAGLGDVFQSIGKSAQNKIKGATRAMVNGTDLSEDPLGNAVGFMALIEGEKNDGSGTQRCSGVAVATDIVVTAGHCVRDVHQLRVKFISNMSPLDFETVAVKDYRMHPLTNGGYEGKMYANFNESVSKQFHDIAVVLLEDVSYFAVPITIAPPEFKPEAGDYGDKFYHFGRGRDENYVYKGNIEFNAVTWPRPVAGGDNYYKADLDKNSKGEFQLACGGDSGGPVTVAKEDEYHRGRDIHYLVGIMTLYNNFTTPKNINSAIAAWGKPEYVPRCGKMIGFVNIQSELPWIRESIRSMDPDNARTLPVFGEK